MSFGEVARKNRLKERREAREELVEHNLSSAWSSLVDCDYSAAVGYTLRTFFRLSGAQYSAVKFLGGGEASGDEYAALADLIHSFNEVAAGGPHEKVHRPIERVVRESDLSKDVWREFSECSMLAPADQRLELALGEIEAAALRRGLIEDPTETTYTLGEDFDGSKLQEIFEKRERQGRSLQVIIVARDNDTGTGKTTLAVQLCKTWDSEWSADLATNRPNEYREFLKDKPEGSVLLADEIGQMYDARRSMSEQNVAVSQDWQMIRTKQYKTLSTLPGPSFLDKRLKKLADIIIVATRRGHARVYRMKVDDESGSLWREHLHNVEWGPIDDDPDYQQVEAMKRERLRERFEGRGEDDDGEQELSDEQRRRVRNELITDLVEGGLSQSEVAEALDLSPSTVSRVLN